MARITEKALNAFVAELIEDGQLIANPITMTGGNLGYGTRFILVDSTVCLGPREALTYIRDHVADLNAYMMRRRRR